ncbi:MAG: type II toxin-antitoxin system Phd/YefM family antitoxin [Acidobacteriaceae bacterium]|nr:type II toxin-antitoxin system Phd/YefM family antitoxin [Acidobacteriaceae bacterium]
MATWQVQEAKAHLSELLEDAESKGPQIITKHGAEKAVVISIEQYRGLQAEKTKLDLRDYLLSMPQIDDFDVDRDVDFGREIEL